MHVLDMDITFKVKRSKVLTFDLLTLKVMS